MIEPKELDEVMKKIIKASLLDNDEELAEQIASDLIAFGYRKPLDRPELREKIREIVSPACNSMACSALNAGADIVDASSYCDKVTDRILALIIPKDKPPLLKPWQIDRAIALAESTDSDTYDEVAQAQRDICIKHYEVKDA